MLVLKTLRILMPAIYWKLKREKKSLQFGGQVHCGSSFSVANVNIYSEGVTKIGAQQIHVLKMRAGIRRAHPKFFAVNLNRNPGWNWVGSKQLVTCLESVISGYK